MRKARKWKEIHIIHDCVYVDGVLFGRVKSIRIYSEKNILIRRKKYDEGQNTLA